VIFPLLASNHHQQSITVEEGSLVSTSLDSVFSEDSKRSAELEARRLLSSLVQSSQYVGEVYSIGYESALVQIHDFHRKQVGGIPSLCFLLATRVAQEASLDFTEEDSSIILLRVMDAASLPNASEAERVRVEVAQRVSGDMDRHWDEAGEMDAVTHNLLSFAGVKCRVIGTFYLDEAQDGNGLLRRFGSDLSNYYPNKGLKVYKPNELALAEVVNYRDPDRILPASSDEVEIGEVRYASTNRGFQGVANVPVRLAPADLLGQKTALFGMTRTGKSNTTKIMAQAVFNLRYQTPALRIGQLIFDVNGEYANENTQDASDLNPAALKNIWRTRSDGQEADIVTYGIQGHPNDPGRKLMLINFHRDLQEGKEIVNSVLSTETSQYLRNFCQVDFEQPDSDDRSATTRYKRRVLVYRALLAQAGFQSPDEDRPQTKGLFNQDLLKALNSSDTPDYQSCGRVLGETSPSWHQLATAFKSLQSFMSTKGSGYDAFESEYVKRSSTGETWADEDLKKILAMFGYANGIRLIGKAKVQHTPDVSSDYAVDIYNDLVAGRLVIIDQASGDPEVNQSSADRVMWHIFRENQGAFREGKLPPEAVVYVEEAHNLLPQGSETDLQNVWVRSAKEGAKYHIGMVYATQEVSSIQRNILKNTANWFIGHLNNTDETKELCKFYDFADFELSIRRAQDRGFLRVKTLSNPFVIPVQVRRFEVPNNAI
jgi:hypothetical protein